MTSALIVLVREPFVQSSLTTLAPSALFHSHLSCNFREGIPQTLRLHFYHFPRIVRRIIPHSAATTQRPLRLLHRYMQLAVGALKFHIAVTVAGPSQSVHGRPKKNEYP